MKRKQTVRGRYAEKTDKSVPTLNRGCHPPRTMVWSSDATGKAKEFVRQAGEK
jgi:hypothetical protein